MVKISDLSKKFKQNVVFAHLNLEIEGLPEEMSEEETEHIKPEPVQDDLWNRGTGFRKDHAQI